MKVPVQGEGQHAPSKPIKGDFHAPLKIPPIHVWVGVRAKTRANFYALLHASILELRVFSGTFVMDAVQGTRL